MVFDGKLRKVSLALSQQKETRYSIHEHNSNIVQYKLDRTMKAGVHSQRKAVGPQLQKPEGSQLVLMIYVFVVR